ncbi:hypothetical protein Aperf_G00000034233 [Anoplocephala perfoliata]
MGDSETAVSKEIDDLEAQKGTNKCLRFLANNWFMLATLIGVGIGFAIAFGVRATNPSEVAITWIGMPGDIYLRILTLTILPLIVANVFLVIAKLDFKKNGIISIVGLSLVICSNLVGSLIGTASAAIVQPGSRILVNGDGSATEIKGSGLTASDVFKDIFLNLFPDNIISVAIFQYRTEVVNATTNEKVGRALNPGTNMIGVLFIAVVFGLAANAVGPVAKPLITFCEAISAVVAKIMTIFLRLTPIGVCFMVAGSVVSRTNIESDFAQLGLFIATVIIGLLVYLILVILLLLVISRKNPVRLLKYCPQPFLISFAATTTSVAIGEMYKQLDKYGCKEMVYRFLLPVTVAMKNDGPAIFISSACIFVVQQSHVEVDASKIVFIILLTFATTCAMPPIPSASMVLVVTVLSSIGLPSESASLLYAMEWLLDRCRTGLAAVTSMYFCAITSDIYDRRMSREDEAFDEEFHDSDDADHPIFVKEV